MKPVVTKQLVHDYVTRDEEGNLEDTRRALDHLDLTVEQGQFIAVLGANGSGKSTLAKHLNALLVPTEGQVLVCDMDTADDEHLLEIRKSAGMVFQNPDNQIVASVVEEDVGFGPENLGVPSEDIIARVEQCLNAVGMSRYHDYSPNHLSGGQKQRVAIAGILAMEPRCILLDEPTAMLDPVGRREVIDTVLRLNREKGITIILITHYMEEVIDADRVIVMDHGKIAMTGTPREIFARIDELRKLRLEVPQATALAYAAADAGIPVSTDVLTPGEAAEALRKALKAGKGETSEGNAAKETAEGNAANETAEGQGVNETAGGHSENESAEDRAENTIGDTNGPILSLQNVSFVYGEHTAFETVAVNGISLDVMPGEYIGLIGHTGSGKSTLIQLMNGLEKPSSGVVRFEGEDIWGDKYNRRELRSNVGLVFQYPDHQLFESSVIRDVCYGPGNLGLSEEEIQSRAEWALTLVGMERSRWDDPPMELSGGLKRKAAIAGVLAMKPRVLILDEPTAGLDPCGRDEILAEIDRIRRETGMSVILVSHRMEDVARYADRLLVMDSGNALFTAPPKEVFRHSDSLEKAGLEIPQVTQVLNLLAEDGTIPASGAVTVEEAMDTLVAAYRGRNTK